jgi:hypothetical protein
MRPSVGKATVGELIPTNSIDVVSRVKANSVKAFFLAVFSITSRFSLNIFQ